MVLPEAGDPLCTAPALCPTGRLLRVSLSWWLGFDDACDRRKIGAVRPALTLANEHGDVEGRFQRHQNEQGSDMRASIITAQPPKITVRCSKTSRAIGRPIMSSNRVLQSSPPTCREG